MAFSNFAMQRYRLYRKMTRNIPEAAKDAANSATVKGAQRIAALQKQLVPVDEGDLRDSIVVTKPGGTTPLYSQPGGQKIAREGQALITAGDFDVRYPHLVEYGTAPHINAGQFAGTVNPGAKAQPFFWPAYRSLRTPVKSSITRAINKALKDAAKGGSG